MNIKLQATEVNAQNQKKDAARKALPKTKILKNKQQVQVSQRAFTDSYSTIMTG